MGKQVAWWMGSAMVTLPLVARPVVLLLSSQQDQMGSETPVFAAILSHGTLICSLTLEGAPS